MKGVKRYKPSIIKCLWDTYSIKNMANNTVISLYRERWHLTYHGDHFVMDANAKSLCAVYLKLIQY